MTLCRDQEYVYQRQFVKLRSARVIPGSDRGRLCQVTTRFEDSLEVWENELAEKPHDDRH